MTGRPVPSQKAPPRPTAQVRPGGKTQGPAQAGPHGCAACEAAMKHPGQPCDVRELSIACGHCGKKKAKREAFKELKWVWEGAPRYIRGAESPANLFETVADYHEGYKEDIVLNCAVDGRPHPATHPAFVAVRLSDKLTKTTVGTKANFSFSYPKTWFDEAVSQAKHGNAAAAISALFFPKANQYQVHCVTCGIRPGGKAWGPGACFRVNVFPSDVFKLVIKLPKPHPMFTRSAAGGREGQTQYSALDVTRKGDVQKHYEYHRGAKGRFAPGDRVREKPAEPESGLKAIELEREGEDVSVKIGLEALSKPLVKTKEIIEDIVEAFHEISKSSPQVGWHYDIAVQLFAGQLNLEWGWKEGPHNLAYKWGKAEGRLDLVEGKLEVSFGIKIPHAVVRAVLSITGTLSLGASGEMTPTGVGDFKAFGRSDFRGEVKLEAAFGDSVKVEAVAKSGIRLETSIKLAPHFTWTCGVTRLEAKGEFKVQALGGHWEWFTQLWSEKELWTKDLIK